MLQRGICKCPYVDNTFLIFPTCLEQVSPPVLVLFAEYFENEKFQTFKQVYKFGLELFKLVISPPALALAVKTPAPAVKTSAPAVKTPAPAVKTSAPAVKTLAPAVKTPAPAVKTPAPAREF